MFKTLNYLRVHVKGHVGRPHLWIDFQQLFVLEIALYLILWLFFPVTGYKPFKCLTCQKEFLTGYVLKKHMETHISERRYKCGECGKQFKAIGHVREHMRAHSDERPYHCSFCDKSYKTKVRLIHWNCPDVYVLLSLNRIRRLSERSSSPPSHSCRWKAVRVSTLLPWFQGKERFSASHPTSHRRKAIQVLEMWTGLCWAWNAKPPSAS